MRATVLITRPTEDAARLATELRALVSEVRCLCLPVFEIIDTEFIPPNTAYDAIIVTSRHAVRAAAVFRGVPAYCVGDATAVAAQNMGCRTISAQGTAADLVALLSQTGVKTALHLHGEHTRGDVARRLTETGVITDAVVVYRQKERRWATGERAQVEQCEALIVPLYSPRTAELVSINLTEYRGALTLVAISNATVEVWKGPKPDRVIVADRPDGDAMKKAIASLFS